MKKLLNQLGLHIPNIEEYDDGFFRVENTDNDWKLSVDNEQWMVLRRFNQEVFEFYSHVDLAYGKCICTGLGLAIREKSLLAKPEVTEVVVVEKNESVINYHKTFNPDIVEKLTIVHGDANTYEGECDTLLIDHYEEIAFSNPQYVFDTVKKLTENIKHKTMWFWPLEKYIINPPPGSNNKIGYPLYQDYRVKYPTLPDLTIKELIVYCSLFYFVDRVR